MKLLDIIRLSAMEDVEIREIFAMNQGWRSGQYFVMKNPRPRSAILWFCGCEGCFSPLVGEKIAVPRNSLVYIPEGTQYRVDFLDCDSDVSTVLVDFGIFASEKAVLSEKITLLNVSFDDGRIAHILKKLVTDCSSPSKQYLKLKRDMYGLLSLISEAESRKSFDRGAFKQIEAGIEYLQKDDKQELSIDEIAGMCFVTPAYFRRLFKEYSGLSPSEYRCERRMEKARELLEHTDITVEALSELLGYADPSYFCRVFKKTVGISPSQYKKNMAEDK